MEAGWSLNSLVYEFPRMRILRLSEKSRTRLQHSPPGRKKGTFRPILPSVYSHIHGRSVACTPFSDSLSLPLGSALVLMNNGSMIVFGERVKGRKTSG